jgi:Ca2+-transporting ATPase
MENLGLTREEAAKRLLENGANELPSDSEKSLFRVVASVLREPMLLLLVIAGVISFVLAERLDGILLMSTVFIIVGISVFQERRTEQALSALRELSAPLALVIRSGETIRIPSSQVVPGDLIQLLEGDRVIADAELIECKNLQCDESLLTGESNPVPKFDGDSVFSGSLVIQGHGNAIVKTTGQNTQLGKIGVSLLDSKTSDTRLQQSVRKIVRGIGVAALLTVIGVIAVYGVTRGNWLEGALAGIAVAMALIPEELPVILTIFMALGAWRMAREKVVVRKPAAIEALGSVTVLCVDKTGTLTRNEMEIQEIHTAAGKTWRRGETPSEEIRRVMEIGALATPKIAFDPMDRAFKSMIPAVNSNYESLSEIPLNKSRLIYTHVWRHGDLTLLAAKGAPEHIARICRISGVKLAHFNDSLEMAARRGFRVIGIAEAQQDLEVFQNNISIEANFKFIGLALLHDPVREGVPAAINECKSAGIRTIMITGDHPLTALNVASEIGLDARRCVTGDEISQTSENDLTDLVKSVSVFARVTHEHKLRLVKMLQAQGEVVGMTGDGVNDAPALRAADIGIAMGARGTDVAREASAMVITDDNFTSIVTGVKRGRAIYANIKKAISYVIAIHIPIFGMAIVPITNPIWPLVFLPALVAFHEIIIDPACSIVFEVESVDPNAMLEDPRAANAPLISLREFSLAITQGFSVFALLATIYFFAISNAFSEERIRSLAFATLLVSNLFLIMINRSKTLTIWSTIRSRQNRALPWVLLLALAILVLLIHTPILQRAFELAPLTIKDYLFIIPITYLSLCWTDILKRYRIKSALKNL